MKKWMLILLVGVTIGLIVVIPSIVQSTNKQVQIILDGSPVDIPFIIEEGTTYVPIRQWVNALNGTLQYHQGTGRIEIKTAQRLPLIIDISNRRILKESLWHEMPLLVREGHTYYPLKLISQYFGRKVEWEPRTRDIYVYHKVRYNPSQSIARRIGVHGMELEGERVNLRIDDMVVTIGMEGRLQDITLLSEERVSHITERRYALFWQHQNNQSYTLLTLRSFGNDQYMLFAEGYSPTRNTIFLEKRHALGDSFTYAGNLFLYREQGDMRWLDDEIEIVDSHRIEQTLAENQFFSWMVAASNQDLTLTQGVHQQAYNSSLQKHRNIWWLTPKGANRRVPEAYLNLWVEGWFFHNLQAGTPLLLIDAYKQSPHPLLKIFLDNAMYTLVKQQGSDGFWRTKPNAAYLNRAFGLGGRFIDTRMSADASIFLLDYYYQFGSSVALEKAAAFARYFAIHDQNNQYYQLGEGRLYPDYFSERQRRKPLVSLNHVLYEINYLLMLDDIKPQPAYRAAVHNMLKGLEASKNFWIAEDGDLYYALNHEGTYYGRDYLYITYRDLWVTKSLLLRHRLASPAVDELLKVKHAFLQAHPERNSFYETDLSLKRVFETFDQEVSENGNTFLATPVQIHYGEVGKHVGFGAFHWITGAIKLDLGYRTIDLLADNKYMMIDLKDTLIVMDAPSEDIFLNERLEVVLQNGEQINHVLLIHEGELIEVLLDEKEFFTISQEMSGLTEEDLEVLKQDRE